MTPQRGEAWEQHRGKKAGRRGMVIAASPFQVVLDSLSWPPPARRFTIGIDAFTRDWKKL